MVKNYDDLVAGVDIGNLISGAYRLDDQKRLLAIFISPKAALVAVQDEKIITAVTYKIITTSRGKVRYLYVAYTDAEEQGSGLGSRLYEATMGPQGPAARLLSGAVNVGFMYLIYRILALFPFESFGGKRVWDWNRWGYGVMAAASAAVVVWVVQGKA